MKSIGLLLVLLGGVAFWLLGMKCYTFEDFQQELANWLHVSIGAKTPGSPVTRRGCQ